VLGQVHVAVLIVVIRVFLRVLDFVREVRHLNIMEAKKLGEYEVFPDCKPRSQAVDC
jgi:hypothetical protein